MSIWNYHLVNKWTWMDKYVMLLLEKIFDAIGQPKVFSTLDLWFGYHQTPLKKVTTLR